MRRFRRLSSTARLGAFAEMQRQAENAFPEIHNRLNRVIEDLQSGAQSFHGLEEVIRRSFEQAEANVREIAQGHTENVDQMASSMRETMENAQREAAGRVSQIIDQSIRQFQSGSGLESRILSLGRGLIGLRGTWREKASNRLSTRAAC